MQNLDVTSSVCGKKHWGKPCYKEFGACFGCGKHGHMIQDCPENKKFIIGKLKEENKEYKQKPRVQERVFAMTHQDAQATSNMVIGIIQIYTLNARILIDPNSIHSLFQYLLLVYQVCLLVAWTLI